jgi:16S rRNA (guanine966-N2)-methyltransferase
LLTDAVVVDLYAGSGALGLEALSRGAARVTLVERDRAALAALRSNLTTVARPDETEGAGEVVAGDALGWLRRGGGTVDLVLADPPYDASADDLASLVDAAAGRAPGGTVVLETGVTRDVGSGAPPPPEGWRVTWQRRFGDTLVTFFQAAATIDQSADPS